MKNSALVLILSALILTGCAKRAVPTVEKLESRRVTVTPREVPVTIQADTSEAAYRFTPGPVPSLERLVSVAGQRAAEPWVELDTAGVLRIKCPCLEHTENVTVNDTREEQTTSTVETRIEYTNIVTGWQWFQIWSGRILLAIALLWIVYRIIRAKTFGK